MNTKVSSRIRFVTLLAAVAAFAQGASPARADEPPPVAPDAWYLGMGFSGGEGPYVKGWDGMHIDSMSFVAGYRGLAASAYADLGWIGAAGTPNSDMVDANSSHLTLSGWRSNNPRKGSLLNGAFFVDGSAQYVTVGGMNTPAMAHGVAGTEANLTIPITKDVQCLLAVGFGPGGTYGNYMGHDGGKTLTSAYGAGGYLGAGCSSKHFDLTVHNDVVLNLDRMRDPSNPTIATSEHKIDVAYWLGDRGGISLDAKVDVDFRDAKPLTDLQVTAQMFYLIDGRGKPLPGPGHHAVR